MVHASWTAVGGGRPCSRQGGSTAEEAGAPHGLGNKEMQAPATSQEAVNVVKEMWLMHPEVFILLLWLINLKKDDHRQDIGRVLQKKKILAWN
jgi:hypothetical protein